MMSKRPFHLMTKPIGPMCNLDCAYCFYLKKSQLFSYSNIDHFRMSDEILEQYTKDYINSQPDGTEEVVFTWQGGEPTLRGVDFFKSAIGFQEKYKRAGMVVSNTLQTNATLITDDFARFFYENNILIGVSIDGPEEIHNYYRKDKAGAGSFSKVMKGIEVLKKYRVDFNTLTVIQHNNSRYPTEVYGFLKSIGSKYLQFIPVVEPHSENNVSPRSVSPEQYSSFMNTIFTEWLKEDVGKVFINMFDMLLGIYLGYPASFCVHSKYCGSALALEHDGSVYSCDHFVTSKYKVGHLSDVSLAKIVDSIDQINFGMNKFDTLPEKCLKCKYLKLCYGACPKDRINDGLNYLCKGYYSFYKHTEPVMIAMAKALNDGSPATDYKRYL